MWYLTAVGLWGRKSQSPASSEGNTCQSCLLVRAVLQPRSLLLYKSSYCGVNERAHEHRIKKTGHTRPVMHSSSCHFFLLLFPSLLLCAGTIHAVFEKGNNHYTWKKVTTTVHNIIVGKLWIDQVSQTCLLRFGDANWWSVVSFPAAFSHDWFPKKDFFSHSKCWSCSENDRQVPLLWLLVAVLICGQLKTDIINNKLSLNTA